MSVDRRQFLQMAGAAAVPVRSSAASCILVWQRGGASQVDTFDPKSGSIAARLPLIARQMRHLTIVRSVTSSETNHELATAALRFGAPPAECSLDSESPSLRDRYGRTALGEACLRARRAVQSGARFVTVDGGLDWDTHRDHFRAMETLLPQFDRAFAALVEDLDERQPARLHAGRRDGRVRTQPETQPVRRPRPSQPGVVGLSRRRRITGRPRDRSDRQARRRSDRSSDRSLCTRGGDP